MFPRLLIYQAQAVEKKFRPDVGDGGADACQLRGEAAGGDHRDRLAQVGLQPVQIRMRARVESLGVTPKVVPIRGGTDGARLSFEGLPCPNLCTGGENFHGRFEYVPADDMETITNLLAQLMWQLAE